MLIFRESFEKLKSNFSIEKILHMIIFLIIFAILIASTFSVLKPIDLRKYNNIVMLSSQATYPHTQQLAQQLLLQHEIRVGDYMKLMFAQQQESSKVREYPAMNMDEE